MSVDTTLGYSSFFILTGPHTTWDQKYAPDIAFLFWELYQPNWPYAPPQGEYSSFNLDASDAGDFNGDGLVDVVIGGSFDGFGDPEPTNTLFIRGRPDTTSPSPNLKDEIRGLVGYPHQVQFVGDLDADGLSDIIYRHNIWVDWLPASLIPDGGVFNLEDVAIVMNVGETSCEDINSGFYDVGDWSGDGVNDMVTRCYWDKGLSDERNSVIYLMDGAGVASAKSGDDVTDYRLGGWFDESSRQAGIVGFGSPRAFPDSDGDGLPEVSCGGTSGAYLIPSSDGVPELFTDATERSLKIGALPSQGDVDYGNILTSGDIDGDGYSEMLLNSEALFVVRGWDIPWNNPEYW